MKFIPVNVPKLHRLEKKYINECISTNWISSGGYFVLEFEKKFSQIHSGINSLAVTSGTTAIHLALVSLGIGKGDEVIVPNKTWIATAHAVQILGAKTIIVDTEQGRPIIDVNLYA